MANLDRVIPEMAQRVTLMIADGAREGLALVVACGFRPIEDQRRKYAEYEYYLEDPKHHPWAALAAKPGTSNHGKVISGVQHDATAVDVDCVSPTAANIDHHGRLATKWGLYRAVKGEYWHLELAPNRRPLQLSEEQAMGLVIQPVGVVRRGDDTASAWAFGARGHVYAIGAAQYMGGWSDATQADATHHCVALVSTESGNGYWLVSNKGEIFAYGDAKWPGNYQPGWGAGEILGAYRNTRQPGGGVTLVRDDDQRLNPYALPA